MTGTWSAPVEKQRVLDLLDAAQTRSTTLAFWWRDDDAETVTPQLERLLNLSARLDLPLGLAVVPKGATAELAARLASEPGVYVLQHGWSHCNHSPPDEKKMELGDHRPPEAIVDELRLGFGRLSGLFPEKFLPVLAPPWNRIGGAAKAGMVSAGLVGLSTFGPVDAGEPHRANVHLDIFAWKPARRPLSPAEAYAALSREIARRLDRGAEPIGIMTHHLVHTAESWALLDEMFGLLRRHPAISWPALPRVFDLCASAPRT